MAKIPNLKKWKNNENLNARDYVYERDTIVDEVNDQDTRLTTAEEEIVRVEEKFDDEVVRVEEIIGAESDRIDDLEENRLLRDGSLPMTGNFNMDNNDIINLQNINGVNTTQSFSNVAGLLDGTVRAKKAENTDDGLGNANTAQAIKQTVDHVNQDVKDTSTPTFVGVTLGNKTLTNEKLGNLDTSFNHTSLTNNPHSVTKGQVGLSNVDNTSDANKPISTATATALAGKADLENGFVKASQLPSFVDDIVEFETLALLEAATKEVAKIYVVINDPNPVNNTSYRFTASGQLVKFDHTSAEWGHITGVVADQTDIENAVFTSTVNDGLISGTTVKAAINDLDGALKTTNSNVATNAGNISTNAGNISTNATSISNNATAITNIANGTTDITFDPGSSGLASTKVEEAIIEVQSNVDALDDKVDDIVDGTTDIEFDVRATNLVSQNIEDVIHEIYGQKAQPNGIATLGSDGRVPTSQLTISAIEFKGTFGSTSSTTNGDLPSNAIKGDLYVCDENNYFSVEANLTFNNGDKALFDGTNWFKNDATDEVISVNNKTGAVTLAGIDIGVDTTNFNKNLVNTDNTVQKALDRLDNHNHVEADITDLDKYTQSEIDAFLADKVDVGALSSNIILYPTSAPADVSGYFKLVTSLDDPDYDSVAQNILTVPINGPAVLLAELISEPNLFIGNPGVINVPVIGQIRKAEPNPDVSARFFFEIYKRDINGVEELLGTSDATQRVNSIIYEEFSASAILNNGVFTETDRVVFKFYGTKVAPQNGAYEFLFGGATPVRALLDVPVSVTLQANRIAYNNTESSLVSQNLQAAMDELDDKLQSNLTTIRVEQFNIVNPDNGDNTFTYKDANQDNQIGVINGDGFYIFDLQVSGYFVNNNLVEVNINDDTHYYVTDVNQLREGDPDNEGVARSVKVKHNFSVNDEIDVRYYQGVNIAALAVGDGAVSFAKLNAQLQDDITDVRNASSSSDPNTIVKRNATNEFQGILDGKFKTPRTIALAGDVTGQAQFDGSSGITIQTIVAKQNFDGGNALSVYSPEDIIIEGGGA